MNNDSINWEIELNGNFIALELEEIKQLLAEGKITPATKVRRDSLRWVEIRDVPILMNGQQFNYRHLRNEPGFFGNAPQQSETHQKYKPVYSERERNEQEYKALKRKERDRRERYQAVKPKAETFGLFPQLGIVLIFSAIVAFGWLKYTNYYKWNPTVEDQAAAEWGTRKKNAVDLYKEAKVVYLKSDESPSKKEARIAEAEQKTDELYQEIMRESLYDFFKYLLFVFSPLAILVIFTEKYKK